MAIRNIVTSYYLDLHGEYLMKSNRASYPETAFSRACDHLRKNSYSAMVAEIRNEETGKLYAVIVRNIRGIVKVHFQDDSLCVMLTLPGGEVPEGNVDAFPKIDKNLRAEIQQQTLLSAMH